MITSKGKEIADELNKKIIINNDKSIIKSKINK